MKKNTYMREYWLGYRFAKQIAQKCGLDAMHKKYRYGLQGKSDAYCSGYAKAIQRTTVIK